VLITSVIDQNDRATSRCAPTKIECIIDSAPPIVVSRGSPFTAFLTLWGASPADSVDYFRIRNPTQTPLPLTARLNWRGKGNLDLLWRRCSPFVQVGNPSGATSDSVERTSVTVPALDCWILLVSLRPGTADTVFARLQVTTP
jgi:hypothetical protein